MNNSGDGTSDPLVAALVDVSGGIVRIPIRLKLAGALAVPLLALVGVAGYEVAQADERANEVSDETALATAAVGPGSLISTLQEERNFSSVDAARDARAAPAAGRVLRGGPRQHRRRPGRARRRSSPAPARGRQRLRPRASSRSPRTSRTSEPTSTAPSSRGLGNAAVGQRGLQPLHRPDPDPHRRHHRHRLPGRRRRPPHRRRADQPRHPQLRDRCPLVRSILLPGPHRRHLARAPA